MLAGARSFTAIAEWAADADEETLARLEVSGPVPSESTFRRTLQYLDADAFDALAGEWGAQRATPAPGRRRVIAVDGKTLRGSGGDQQPACHLLAALDHAHGVVLGQVEVGAKTNEIPCPPRCWTASRSTVRSSPRMLRTPSAPTPNTCTAAAPTTC